MMMKCKHDWDYKRELKNGVEVKVRYCRHCPRKEIFIRNPQAKFFDDGIWVEDKK